jgi:hypothetical protein
MAAGHLYRVGKDWYADTALLQRAARRHVVEPMQGAYQILAPAGLVRCAPAHGLALPGQTGDLFRCQGQRAARTSRPIVRDLGHEPRHGAIGGEWDAWPASAAPTGHACGCTACKAGGACTRTRTPSPCVHRRAARRQRDARHRRHAQGGRRDRDLPGEAQRDGVGVWPLSRVHRVDPAVRRPGR